MNSKKKNNEEEEAPKVAEPTFTPAEYRDKFCMVKSKNPGGERSVSASYAAANALFCWSQQAHHYGADSFKMTAGDFERAILSAVRFPCVALFPAAVPAVIKDKFKGFKPKGSNPKKAK